MSLSEWNPIAGKFVLGLFNQENEEMMSRQITPLLIWLGVFVLVACNYPVANQELQTTAEVVYTQAAETISAQLTQIAVPATPTASGGQIQATPTSEFHTPTPASLGQTTTPEITPGLPASPTFSPPLPTLITDPRTTLGTPTLLDNFNNRNNWSVYEDEHVRFRIRDNTLEMMAFNANGRDGWMLSWPEAADFYLEMTAQPEHCQGLDRYGLIFRSDSNDGYLLGLSCDGRYSLRSWDGEQFEAIIDWTSIPAISSGSGQALRLGVMAVGDQLKLYINGQMIDAAEDDLFSDGGVGVFIGADETADFRVTVSEFAFWKLP